MLCSTVNPQSGPIYRASCFVVVPIHSRARVRAVLSGIGKLSGHQHPELSVLAAAAPLPALPRGTLVVGITATHGGRAFSAGPRHSKRHARRGDGVDESRLSSG